MIALLCPEHRVIVLTMIVWSWAANAASAQALVNGPPPRRHLPQ